MEPLLLAVIQQTALRADQKVSEAFLALVDALTQTLHFHLLETMEQDAAEPVHKARVTLRRFRAAVSAFAPIIEEDLAEAMADRARAIFRLLGSIRDADVMAVRFADTDRGEELAKEALRQRQKTRKLLKKKRALGFHDWAQKRLKGKGWRRTGKKAKELREALVPVLATQALNRAWSEALSNGTDLAAMSPRAQHELRKDLKMLRYLSEFFTDLWPAAPHDAFLTSLRHLQDDLGEITDQQLAKTLGHEVEGSAAAFASKAVQDWAALVAVGPWWAEPGR